MYLGTDTGIVKIISVYFVNRKEKPTKYVVNSCIQNLVFFYSLRGQASEIK